MKDNQLNLNTFLGSCTLTKNIFCTIPFQNFKPQQYKSRIKISNYFAMRIIKRLRLLSSLSSDPPLNNPSPLVQVQLQQDQQQQPNQASNVHLTKNPTWVSQTNEFESSSKNLEGLKSNDEAQDGKEEKTNKNDIIIRKQCTLNEEVNISSLAPLSPPSSDQGHQYSNCEWKSNTNKKSTMYEDDDNLKLLAKTTEVYVGDGFGNCSSSSTTISKRKKIRGSVLLEGSRCSRRNGRGWRCCQPTLVGYSLCEHHLGKGRLRTMSNVTARNRKQPMMGTSANAPKDDEQTQEQRTWFGRINQEKRVVGTAIKDGKHDDRYNNDDDEKELSQFTMNKTKRLGKVRARSMSSLLVAIDNATMGASQQLPKQ